MEFAETYRSSMTHVAIRTCTLRSRLGTYLHEKQARSRSAPTESFKEKEKFVRVIVPRLLRRFIEIADIDNRAKRGIEIPEVETFLVRGKASFRKLTRKVDYENSLSSR